MRRALGSSEFQELIRQLLPVSSITTKEDIISIDPNVSKVSCSTASPSISAIN